MELENEIYYTVSVYNNVDGTFDIYKKVIHIDINEHYLTLEFDGGRCISINHNNIFKYIVY